MNKLTEFVTARLDEDEAAVKRYGLGEHSQRSVDTKRAIVAAYAEVTYMDTADPEPEYAYGRAGGLGEAVRHLAAAWSDHPDYWQEWAI